MLPHHPGVRALVIGIANSIDLTERALPALKLRGCTPSLLAFPAYSTAQVSGILKACLEQVDEK
jgi:cell division control protein 6